MGVEDRLARRHWTKCIACLGGKRYTVVGARCTSQMAEAEEEEDFG